MRGGGGEDADEGPAKVHAKKMSLGVVRLQGQWGLRTARRCLVGFLVG